MPVDFQIKNAKISPSGALALVIDRSGSMGGEKIQMAVRSAMAAAEVLTEKDYISVTAFDDTAYEIVPMVKLDNLPKVKRQIASIGAGGGTYMYPAIEMGYKSFAKAQDVAIKHMLILTDGQTQKADHEALIKKMRSERITVSTVAVGGDADKSCVCPVLLSLAAGSSFTQPLQKALPRIFQEEARKIARPLITKVRWNRCARAKRPIHDIIKGIDSFPPITGYVRTTLKNNPLGRGFSRS